LQKTVAGHPISEKDIFALCGRLQFNAVMRVLIVGCGYVGLPLGNALVRAGHEVTGLRRSRSAEPELCAAGIRPFFADITDPLSLRNLPGPFDWVVLCAAVGGGGPDAYRRTYLEGTGNLLSWLDAHPPERLVYTGSTSVYAQDDGSWVTEQSATEPATKTGTILLQTESLLRQAAQDRALPVTVLRLAGIYGPDRGYWFKQFRSGQATLTGDGRRYLNMIHRDDVVGAILRVLDSSAAGPLYNVVDNEPVSQRDLFGWLSDRLRRPVPPVTTETLPRRRGATNKRVSNAKLREELGYPLQFPTFREGFKTL
jgi:nucleoside-diphosphate-sugar epimerase